MPGVERVNLERRQYSEQFHLLFLSEGFVDPQRFARECNQMAAAFQGLDPWSSAKIGIWRLFVPSTEPGLGADTAFRFYLKDGARAITDYPQRIVDAIRAGEVALPRRRKGQKRVPASAIWLHKPADFSAVCVLIDTATDVGVTYRDYSLFDSLREPTEVTYDLEGLLPFVVLSNIRTWQGLANAGEANAWRLAHELGHLFGLADEYELDGPDRKQYPGTIEPAAPNITALVSLHNPAGALDPAYVKWRSSIKPDRRDTIFVRKHPPAPADPPDPAVAQEIADVAALARERVMLLQHPWAGEEKNRLRYVPGGAYAAFQMDEPNVIEGGGLYRLGLLRPSCECAMRYPQYEKEGGGLGFSGYCRICRMHLFERLAGSVGFDLRTPKIFQGDIRARGERVPSALAAAFVEHIEKYPALGNVGLCVEATLRRYEDFLCNAVKWRRWERPVQPPRPPWESLSIRVPHLRAGEGRHDVWNIWVTAQKEMRSGGLIDWAAQGAAGALVHAGFGSLVNEYAPAGPDYALLQSLAPEDLKEYVEPGALLQLWKGAGEYEGAVKYICGAVPEVANPPARDGHSLVYMRYDDADGPIVADQNGVARTLRYWVAIGYDFIIAAQWFDGWWPGAKKARP